MNTIVLERPPLEPRTPENGAAIFGAMWLAAQLRSADLITVIMPEEQRDWVGDGIWVPLDKHKILAADLTIMARRWFEEAYR